MAGRHVNSELLSVCPEKMIFYAPYDRTQNRLITIMNPTADRLLFKLLSNAHWQYNVNPNCGCVEPYDTSEVRVSLSFFDFHSDKTYSHHFCIKCIQAPTEEQYTSSEILCLFKETHKPNIESVRLPIELKPNGICICQAELDTLLPPEVQEYLWKWRPLGISCVEHLRQLAPPPKPKQRCGLARVLMTILVILSGLAAAFFHRQQIEDTLYMHMKLDDVEF